MWDEPNKIKDESARKEDEASNKENETKNGENKSKNDEYIRQMQKKIDELKVSLKLMKHRWIGVLWMIMMFVVLLQNEKIQKLSNQLMTLNHWMNHVNGQLMNISSDVNQLDDSIAEEVKQQMQQAISEMNSFKVEYIEINPVKKEVTAKLFGYSYRGFEL